MYDLNKNGYITRDEFKVILNMMVGANITAEQLDSIADRTITEADFDQDGKISFEEFCRAMEKTDIEQKMSIRFLNWTRELKPNRLARFLKQIIQSLL